MTISADSLAILAEQLDLVIAFASGQHEPADRQIMTELYRRRRKVRRLQLAHQEET